MPDEHRVYAHHGETQKLVHSLDDVAPLLNATPSWLAERCRRGLIEHTLIGGRYGLTAEQIERLIAQYTRTPSTPSAPSHPGASTGKARRRVSDKVHGTGSAEGNNTLTARPPRRRAAQTTTAHAGQGVGGQDEIPGRNL